MRLAKPHLDLGMFTADLPAHKDLWEQQVGLRLDHQLPFDETWVQHRYDAHNSVIKVNHYQRPLPVSPPSGYVGLTIARAGTAQWTGQTPEGQWVRVVAPGTDGVTRIGITVETPHPDRLMDFYLGVMQFDAVGPRVARCGDTLLWVSEGPGGSVTPEFIGRGYRYLTVQIFDADAELAGLLERGARLGQAAVNFGTVARYGFVLDPDGNWIEVSARTSLTGIAPPQ